MSEARIIEELVVDADELMESARDRVIRQVATIHQQHSIKGLLALQDLIGSLSLTQAEITQLIPILAFEPQTPLQPLSLAESMVIPPKRWRWLLDRGVMPASYFALNQWVQADGFDAVMKRYIERACDINGYLGHHITVLLALARIWPQLTVEQQPRLLERLAEFIATTFDRPQHSEPLADNYQPAANRQQLIADVIRQPGFLAHNWITLAVLLREQQWLTEPQCQRALELLHQRCYWQFDDSRDHPPIEMSSNGNGVEALCRQLLLNRRFDLHQLTIADAAMWLHQHGQLNAESQRWLQGGLEYVTGSVR